MTLLDAPAFDTVRDRRNRTILFSTVAAVGVLIIAWWFAAGMPIDWPWSWNNHWRGTVAVDRFLKAVEQNDMNKAYGIWIHDPDWQKHPDPNNTYTFARFEQDWSPNSSGNDYGAIKTHVLRAARMYGNVLVVGIMINDRKSGALFLAYDTKTHQIGFSPVELYLGP
jgi:hypothetical protein